MSANRLALLGGLSLMELGWTYPWGLLLGTWVTPDRPRALLSPISVLTLVLLGALATQIVVRSLGTRRVGQACLIGLGLVCIAVAVRTEQFASTPGVNWVGQLARDLAGLLGKPTAPALAVAFGMVLWWRGVGIGSGTLTFYEADITFRWGIGALVVGGILLAVGTSATVRPVLEAEAAPFVVGFFFVGLLTLALARLESLRSRTRALGLNTQWLGVLIAVAGLLVLTALVVAQVLSFDLLVVATQPLFNLIGLVLLLLLLLIVIPLAYVVEWLVFLILQLMRRDDGQAPPEPLQPGEIEEFLRRLFGQGLPAEVIDALRAIGAAVLLLVGLLVVARTVAHWRPASGTLDGAEEERDSLWEPVRLRDAVLAWLRGVFRRARPAGSASASVALAAAPAESVHERTVRELYRRLLRLGTSAGAARPVADTPLEHLPRLENALEPIEDLEQLTDAYVLARYAERPTVSSEVEALERRLERVQRRLAPTDEASSPKA